MWELFRLRPLLFLVEFPVAVQYHAALILPRSAAFAMTTPTRVGDRQAPAASAAVRQIGFLPLLALFYGYTAGGPFGY